MTIKEQLTEAMTELGHDPDTVFIGYNVAHGKAAGTLSGVDDSKLIETPLAENLMAGMAIGLSLEGKIPILFFERFDFILNALDAIVNHLDKLALLSEGLHRPACIIRVVVGNRKIPLFTGATHTQDFTGAMRAMVGFPVISLWWRKDIMAQYQEALALARRGTSTMLVEFKDHWEAIPI